MVSVHIQLGAQAPKFGVAFHRGTIKAEKELVRQVEQAV
jgi:hypothetical protein